MLYAKKGTNPERVAIGIYIYILYNLYYNSIVNNVYYLQYNSQ